MTEPFLPFGLTIWAVWHRNDIPITKGCQSSGNRQWTRQSPRSKCLIWLRTPTEMIQRLHRDSVLVPSPASLHFLKVRFFDMPLSHHVPPISFYNGPLVIGTLVNTILYTIEVVAVLIYRRSTHHKPEKIYIKLLVLWNLFVDTVGSFAACATLYTYFIIYWGNDDRARRTHWTLILSNLTNAMAAFTVQGFLNYRYWKLSSNWFVSVLIFLLMLFAWAATLHLVISSASPSRKAIDRILDVRDISTALASAIGVDIAINAALCTTLFRMETFNRATKMLILRIVTLALATGAATSFFAVITLITYLIAPLSRISTCISLFLGRVYSLTMLYTLIHRETLVRESAVVFVDTESRPNTMTETRSRTRPFTSVSDGMMFAGHENTFSTDSDRSHPASEISHDREEFPQRRMSCRSDAPYHHKNDIHF